MTIAEYLTTLRKDAMCRRREELQRLDAPKMVLAGIEKALENPLKGVGKIKEFGHIAFHSATQHTGLGGKPYVRFANSGNDILYVHGRYGWYLYRQQTQAA